MKPGMPSSVLWVVLLAAALTQQAGATRVQALDTLQAAPSLDTRERVSRLAPQQLRLALAEQDDAMRVMWSTLAPTLESCVQLSAAAPPESSCHMPEGGDCSTSSSAAAVASRRLLQLEASATAGAHRAGAAAQAEAEAEAEASALVCGMQRRFWEPALNRTSQYIHSVLLRGLAPGQRYAYRVGSSREGAWSEWWEFTAKRSAQQFSEQRPLQLLIAGDMGTLNAQALPALIVEAESGQYDAFLLVGDLAYDLQDLQGRRASQFLSLLQPLAARLPFMVLPGNHEAHHNFSHYRQLFGMPGSSSGWESLCWSLDLGPLHLLAYNTEAFFWPEWFQGQHMQRMYDWMAADLAAAAASRQRTPWILAAGHRPMYCAVASSVTGTCNEEHEASRRGLPTDCPHNNPRACRRVNTSGGSGGREAWPVEGLLFSHGVDLAVYGHVHDYERYAPAYNLSTRPGLGSSPQRYLNPRATVHVTSGAGGNKEMKVGPEAPPQGNCSAWAPWCIFQSGYFPQGQQSADYSYSRLKIHNASHAHWQQVSVSFGGVIDDWWLVQERHGPFEP